MSQQIQITGGAKVRNLQDVIIGTSGVLSSVAFDVANGVPRLDVNGKILVSQLPNSVMEYKGVWNAATNTPTLANGTGNQGDVYLCNVAGTVDFGAGPIAFFVGDQVIYSGSIWQRASGATGSVTSVAVTETGDSLNITGSPITTSGTINIGFNGTNLQYVNGAGNLTTFPILTGYVPYTGATANVDLGTFNLTADVITGATGSFASNGGSNTFAINHSSGAGIALNITKGGNGEGLYINKTSGSGNAATIIGTLNATTLVKSGGTSSQFLKADGTVDSTAYGTGSVTSVSALTLGTSGTDLSSSVANSTTTPVITLNVPTASATNRGALSSADWSTFNSKQGTVFATAPISIVSNNISITQASASVDGYLSSTDFNTFNNKISGLGTAGYITRYTGSGSTIGNSGLYDDGTTVSLISRALSGSSASFASSVTATSFVKTSGTSAQFLKADGSVDSSTYLTTSSAASTYLPLTGGTLTGALTGTSATFSGEIKSGDTITLGAAAVGGFWTWGAATSYLVAGTGKALNLNPNGSSGSTGLSIATTGAATFSSSVTANGTLIAGLANGNIRLKGSTDGFLGVGESNGTLYLTDWTTGAKGLSILLSTGAATFSSRVNINGATDDADIALNVSAPSGSGKFIMFGRNSSNTAVYSLSSAGAATFSSSVTAQLLAISNGYYLVGRNAANTAFRTLVTFDSSNKIIIGQDSDITAITLGVGSEAMRITSGGNVLIGNGASDVGSLIHAYTADNRDNMVYTNANASLTYAIFAAKTARAGGTSCYFYYGEANSVTTYRVYNNGNVQNTNNSYTGISDISIKENILDATPKLADLLKVRIVNYNLKAPYENHKQIGVIAQELEKIFPNMIDIDTNTKLKSVKYSIFVPMLIKAVQELKQEIEILKNK